MIMTEFEAQLFLHALSVVRSQAKHKAMKEKMSFRAENLVGLMVQSVLGSCCKLIQACRWIQSLLHCTCCSMMQRRSFSFSPSVSRDSLH